MSAVVEVVFPVGAFFGNEVGFFFGEPGCHFCHAIFLEALVDFCTVFFVIFLGLMVSPHPCGVGE